jgi:hypothetical protein
MVPADAGPTPVQVYERADQVWHEQVLPPYIAFVSHVEDEPDRVRVLIRTRDGAAYTETIPQPPNRKVTAVVDAHLTGPYGAPLGFCVSAVYCSGVLENDPFGPAVPAVNGPNVIAHVYAYADAYAIAFGSITRYHDHDVFELRLEPRFDPKRYELRDMLVDAGDYRIWQMTYRVPHPGYDDATIRYDFGPVGSVWYLRHICDWNSFLGDCGPKSTDLSEFAFYASAPAWLFNTKLWEAHKAEADR